MTENQDVQGVFFRSDEERALFEEARLGQDAITFLRSPLGRWLQAVAEQERLNAMERLINIDFTDHYRIVEAQVEARIAGNFLRWMGEAIQNGRIAEQQLETLEEDNV